MEDRQLFLNVHFGRRPLSSVCSIASYMPALTSFAVLMVSAGKTGSIYYFNITAPTGWTDLSDLWERGAACRALLLT